MSENPSTPETPREDDALRQRPTDTAGPDTRGAGGPGTDGGNEAGDGGDRIVVITPEGMGVAHAPGEGEEKRQHANPASLVEEPAKVMRIGSMIKQLLEEVKSAPLDEAGRKRLAQIHRQSLEELKDGLAPELIEELDRMATPFTDESPSDAELRIAQAQLVGWLEGLFHGIQTALVAQQMAAQHQLAQMRALPGAPGHGTSGPGTPPGAEGGATGGPTGQYL